MGSRTQVEKKTRYTKVRLHKLWTRSITTGVLVASEMSRYVCNVTNNGAKLARNLDNNGCLRIEDWDVNGHLVVEAVALN